MDALSASDSARGRGVLDGLLPLKPWLGPEAARSTELGHAWARLSWTLVGVLALLVVYCFVSIPAAVVAAIFAYALFAFGYAVRVRMHPAPTRSRRAFAMLFDNLLVGYVASFGDLLAVFVAFHFWITVGWGMRFGPRYLYLAITLAILSMGYNIATSAYWQEHAIFGAAVIGALVATTINAAVLLRRIAAANRRLEEKIEEVSQLAWQDQLTKLPNRPYFNERLAQMLAASRRSGRQVALLLFDIDGFKSVNDTLGHEAGDRLLQEIAQRVGRRVRQADTFARVGGDEFVVLMELAHDQSDAIPVAETIMKTIGEIDMFVGSGLRVGASVGIACSGSRAAQEWTPDELLRRADRAMYEAKRAGKGCYKFADESR
jgi:diguanylate cyclase (GGDEF)-like protein